MTFFNVSSAIAGNLVVQTFGGNGDPDVYVKFQSRPTLSVYDGKSDNSGSDEMININHLQTGKVTATLCISFYLVLPFNCIDAHVSCHMILFTTITRV